MPENTPSIFSNERAVASAGSGKTYALTNRYIALSLTCDPASICALTFTRAAAGEFLEKILLKLAEASSSEGGAKLLSAQLAEIGAPKNLGMGDFLALLRKIVSGLPRLSLSTIDAFEMRLLSAFASELGISGPIRVLDSFAEEKLRADILRRMLRGMSSDTRAFSNFFEAVSRANHGDSRSAVFRTLFDYVKSAYAFYCENSDISKWSGSAEFLGSIVPLKAWNADMYSGLYEEFVSLLPDEALKARSRHPLATLRTFFGNSYYCSLANVFTKPMAVVMDMLSKGLFPLREGVEYPECKTLKASTRQLNLVYEMLSLLAGSSIRASVETASAVGSILSAYDRLYSVLARSRGALSFSDLPVLLSASSLEFERGLVEYRLDAKYKHWLLDEFQDTSRAQWRVISNLISENLQSADASRTFYYVGDTKQSIYSWRGGDPKLFDEVFRAWSGRMRNAAELNVSWRSTKPVIDTVNAVFSSGELSGFGAEAAARWAAAWKDHTAHESKGSLGCSMLVRRHEGEGMAEAVFKIIDEIRPSERGLSCAVIVQRNDTLSEIVEDLRSIISSRKLDMSVGGEVDSEIASDNMLVPAVLEYIRAAAHPLDSAAEAYVRMTPLADFVKSENWRLRALSEIASGGFAKFIGGLVSKLEELGFCKDAFTRARALSLLSAAEQFDASEYSDVDSFAEFIKGYKLRESSKRSDIQVVTFHKSKGLDYDIVILPQNANARSASEALRMAKVRDSRGEEIIVNMPSRSLAAFSPALSKAHASMEADAAYEKICMFYVGLTRAKKALYFVLSPNSSEKGSKKYDFEAHLLKSLSSHLNPRGFAGSDSYLAFGNEHWFREIASSETPPRKFAGLAKIKEPRRIDPLPEIDETPSSLPRKCASDLPLEFGSLVHRVFERVKFDSSDADIDMFARSCGLCESDASAISALVKNCLKNGDIRGLFEIAPGRVALVEYPFSVIDGNVQQSGIFDRLLIDLRPDGRIASACVVDFKTNLAGLSDEKLLSDNLGQMSAYKSAVLKIYGLPETSVSVKIVNVSGASVVDCT